MFKFIFSGNSNNISYKAQVKKDLLEELANELEEEMNEMNVFFQSILADFAVATEFNHKKMANQLATLDFMNGCLTKH